MRDERMSRGIGYAFPALVLVQGKGMRLKAFWEWKLSLAWKYSWVVCGIDLKFLLTLTKRKWGSNARRLSLCFLSILLIENFQPFKSEQRNQAAQLLIKARNYLQSVYILFINLLVISYSYNDMPPVHKQTKFMNGMNFQLTNSTLTLYLSTSLPPWMVVRTV